MGVIYSSYEYPEDKSKIVKLEDIPTFPTNDPLMELLKQVVKILLYIKLT